MSLNREPKSYCKHYECRDNKYGGVADPENQFSPSIHISLVYTHFLILRKSICGVYSLRMNNFLQVAKARAIQFFRNFYARRKLFWGSLVVLVIIVLIILFGGKKTDAFVTDVARVVDLKRTILATGQVTSSTDLNLSFAESGLVTTVNVAVGDVVHKGDTLAVLDQSSAKANLTTARGALLSAQANYDKVLTISQNEDLAVAKTNLSTTESTQQTLVDNAYRTLLSDDLRPVPATGSTNETGPTVTGTYTGNVEGTYFIDVYQSGTSSGASFSIHGLEENYVAPISTASPVPLGSRGLFIQFPVGFKTGEEWILEIPNKRSDHYVTNYNAYSAALDNQKSLVAKAEADLALKEAQVTSVDIKLAEADLVSAEGKVQSAQADLDHTVLKAPADGTITAVDIKLGELAQALKEVITVQDIDHVYLEANINEANIADVHVGASVSITFDGLGPDRVFTGTVSEIDPASTLVSGVVNYKIKAALDPIPDIRPGMTANMTILAAAKNHVLTIPRRAVIEKDSGEKVVRVVTDAKKKTYTEANVLLGMEGDGGLVEVSSGITEGATIVVLTNNK